MKLDFEKLFDELTQVENLSTQQAGKLLKIVKSAYDLGRADGRTDNDSILRGHREIMRYLHVSRRVSERRIADLRRRGLLEPGKKGKMPVVSKQILDECLKNDGGWRNSPVISG